MPPGKNYLRWGTFGIDDGIAGGMIVTICDCDVEGGGEGGKAWVQCPLQQESGQWETDSAAE